MPGVALCSAMAWSEASFLALVSASLAGLAAVEVHPAGRRGDRIARLAILSGLAAGLACLARHVGVALLPVGVAWLARRGAGRRLVLSWVAPAAILPLAWWIRGVALFGSPVGPGLPGSRLGIAEVLADLVSGLRWSLVPWPFQAWAGPAGLILFAVAVLALLALARRGVPALVAGVVPVYLLTLVVARSAWTFNVIGERYLAPVVPLVLLAAGATVAGLAGRVRYVGRIALAIAVLAGAASITTIVRRLATPEHRAARAARAAALEELRGLVPGASAPVLSDVGHLVRSATGRPAVQVPSLAFSPRPFTAGDLERWRALGVREGIFERPGPGAGEDALAARLGPWLAARLAPGSPVRWTILAASRHYLRVRL
jgi:hypothetical protein